MATYRIERLNKEFLRKISDLLSNQVKNEIAQEAILTAVDCSRDLGHAKVYFTVIDPSRREEVLVQLQMVATHLRAFLGKLMHLRKIPELHFLYDESEIKAREIDELLDRIKSPSE